MKAMHDIDSYIEYDEKIIEALLKEQED